MALKHINGLIIEEEEGVRVSKFHFYYSFLSRRDLDKLVSFSLIISEWERISSQNPNEGRNPRECQA